MVFHEKFFEGLAGASVVYIEGGGVSDIQVSAVIGEVNRDDFLDNLLDDFGGFEIANDVISELDLFGHLK